MIRPELPGPGLEEYADKAARPPSTPQPLIVNVVGNPIPQGSKVANTFGRGVRDTNAAALKAWRALVADTTRREMALYYGPSNTPGWTPLDGPCQVTITFYHQRPKSHRGTGRNAGKIKPGAPLWKASSPDLDKLTRAILDALTTAGAYTDDRLVARLIAEDRWADGPHAGARIILQPLERAEQVHAVLAAP